MRRKSSSTKHAFIIMLIVDGSGNKMKFNYLHASRQASFFQAFYGSANRPHSYLFSILLNTRSNNLYLA